jgi:glycerophosphoryl diester phosphodiesterase
MQTEIKILAHRGGMDRAPENTIAAFRRAFDDGADAFECDVRLTKDGEPVIIHTGFDDDDIRPVTGSTIPLRALNWSDIKKMKVLDSNQPVAHLDEVLDFVQETGLRCVIEPKESSKRLIPTVVERIREFELVDKVGFVTFYAWLELPMIYLRKNLLRQAKHLKPEIQTSVIIVNPFADFLKLAESINADRVIIGWSGVNQFRLYNTFSHSLRRKVRRLKAAGISVEGGFVRTRGDVRWLLKHQIGGLWADDIPKIRRFVEEELRREDFESDEIES